MLSTDPVTCLFCQHINPAGASFCNHCAAQLNLQPCRNCDAVNDQTASSCHKCATPLPLHRTPQAHAEPKAGPITTPLIPSALGRAMPGSAKVAPHRGDLTLDATVIERSHERSESEVAPKFALSWGSWLVLGTAFVLVLLEVSAYLYSQQSERKNHPAETKAVVLAPSKQPAASAMASKADVAVASAETPRPPAADTEAAPRRVALPGKECLPAVATLGLCTPETAKEEP